MDAESLRKARAEVEQPGGALLAAWALAGQLHPQLGVPAANRVRLRRGDSGGTN